MRLPGPLMSPRARLTCAGILNEKRLKLMALATFSTVLIYYLLISRQGNDYTPKIFEKPNVEVVPIFPDDNHPITTLARDAHVEHKRLLGKQSLTLEQAASRYRERRGRHPPPGFDKWFEVAKNKDAIVVEDFFDRVYHDITPFWALDPMELRRMIRGQPQYIRVWNGTAEYVTDDIEHRQPWIQRWTELVQEMSAYLPDLDMILNIMDETRVLVPWEKMNEYVAEERKTRDIFRPQDAVSDYTGYNDGDNGEDGPGYDAGWVRDDANRYWDYYRKTCPPDSPGRNVSSLEGFDGPISPLYPDDAMPFTLDGFIQNFTAASDPCEQPHLRGMHGTFIESISMATTHELYPMFGGCKLPRNNEMLIPGGMLLDEYDLFSGGETHGGDWSQKLDSLVWRGTASGGRNKVDNWWHFQRHRFVQMMNGTTVALMEAGDKDTGRTFDLARIKPYKVQAEMEGGFGKWLDTFSDVGFMDLSCFPHQARECDYTEPYMTILGPVPMKEQYDHKYLPDVDGNSYSARFRGFMRSTSLPLKATIYSEWHDDRLVPWAHFVPLDNTFTDIYAVMEYFLKGHDAVAQQIAEGGRIWAEKVMRREDMMLYVWRLLLEYARVIDPKRDRLAYVDDLKAR